MPERSKRICLYDAEKLKQVNPENMKLFDKYQIDMSIRDLSKNTVSSYNSDLLQWFIFLYEQQYNLSVTEVTDDDIEEYYYWRKQQGNNVNRQKRVMASISAFYKFLRKNKIKPLKGNKYGCILTAEKAAEVLETYANQITHTSQHEALINGYLGELGGFILFENTDPFMYKNDTTTYGLFFGKGAYGLPVQTVAFGNSSVEVYDNGLGSVPQKVGDEVRPDALHQRGSVAYKVMGFAARIVEDESIIRVELSIEGKEELTVADTARQHYVASSTSGATA